jgi:small-conductance mechanosensitive channel
MKLNQKKGREMAESDNGLPMVMKLPSTHDACPAQARVTALEAWRDAITDEVHVLTAEVRMLSQELKTSIQRNETTAQRSEANIKRSEAINIEMGTHLKRYAEYTERNCKQDERGLAIENRLLELIDTLREQVKSNSGRGKARKSCS